MIEEAQKEREKYEQEQKKKIEEVSVSDIENIINEISKKLEELKSKGVNVYTYELEFENLKMDYSLVKDANDKQAHAELMKKLRLFMEKLEKMQG
jgi:hypothetical protein